MISKNLPLVGITPGDPAGIGPEIIVKSLAESSLYQYCRPVIIGNIQALKRACEITGVELEINEIRDPGEGDYFPTKLNVIDNFKELSFTEGIMQKEGGEAAFAYIKLAIDLLQENKIDATASGPSNKEAIRLAGYQYPGVTEIFADYTNAKEVNTLLMVGDLRILQITTHVSLRMALDLLNYDRILNAIKVTDSALRNLEKIEPILGVAGLNPHAGENGMLGREEIDYIAPAIEEAKRGNINVQGPIPADSLMSRGLRGDFNSLIYLLHDQANIAVKLLASQYPPVALSIGLPVIRTTVAHGTAFDIAYKGIADYKPMYQSIVNAAKLVARTKVNKKK